MDYSKMGERIRILRKKKNLSQEQLAELVNISPGFMSTIEIGNKPGSFDTYIRIANALDTTLDFLSGNIIPAADRSVRENELLRYFKLLNMQQQDFLLDTLRNFCDRFHKT